MVKVIIQTEGKTIVEEGEFFFGTVINDKTNAYDAKNILCGLVNPLRIPKIMAEATSAQVKKAFGPDTLDSVGALIEFSDRIKKEVDKELINDKKQILLDIDKAINELGR